MNDEVSVEVKSKQLKAEYSLDTKTEVKLLRFITGEEIITEIIEHSGNDVVIKNPLRILAVPGKNNQPQVYLVPWSEFTSDKVITLDKSHIIAIMTPVDEFLSNYKRAFSNILTPNPQGLIIPKGV